MTTHRTVLLTAAMALTLLASTAPAAQAALTPVNSVFSAHTGDLMFQRSGGGLFIRCTSGDLTGTISADGRHLSLRPTLRGCTEFLITGTPLTFTCRGSITFAETAWRAGLDSTSSGTLDAGFECSADWPAFRCSITIRGPQSSPSTSNVLSQRFQTFTVALTSMAATGSGIAPCGGAGQTMVIAATFSITSGRVTVS